MPAEAFPVVAIVIAAFSIFMIVVGGVSIWCNMDDQPRQR